MGGGGADALGSPTVLRASSWPSLSRLTGLTVTALPASAAPVLSITPITWNVVGLDSNNVNSGPATFASGARVCNTGDAVATNVASTFVWDSANAFITTTGLTTHSVPSLAAGACTDFYYNLVVTRTASAYNTARSVPHHRDGQRSRDRQHPHTS